MINLASPLLEIKNLRVFIDETEILNDFNLTVNEGEIHAIMGPNGSGKSTFSKVIVGHPAYKILKGNILLSGISILSYPPESRAGLGIFLAFQYPVEIPGVSNEEFLYHAYNSKLYFSGKNRKKKKSQYTGLGSDSAISMEKFRLIIKELLPIVNLPATFLTRNVNQGFSGGEKKRNEILQMLLLDPTLVILDETDSGLDIDALQIIAKGVNAFMNDTKGLILITHYQRLLDYIQPTFVHVMHKGKIIKTGNYNLAKELESRGYEWLID
uniref:Iron-sulfur cluster formation ABC transporter n=1 Tax=Actinocyclus subtilis TaxID=1630683 RepID=A0A2U9NQC5_9STRA|nr:iron-sulfur cluster formation ABC transporter [Actinocyclus subtilis]AWT39252.1 iron-sulfur cluster formation ABC transporter [Actinocyclus subtilis]